MIVVEKNRRSEQYYSKYVTITKTQSIRDTALQIWVTIIEAATVSQGMVTGLHHRRTGILYNGRKLRVSCSIIDVCFTADSID